MSAPPPRPSVSRVAATLTLVFLSACAGSASPGNGQGGAGSPDADGTCPVAAPTSCPSPAIVWADVADTISRRCAEPCHSGKPDGPWPLTNKMHVADWAPQVRDELSTCAMPPPDSGVVLTSAERTAILTWIRCGLM